MKFRMLIASQVALARGTLARSPQRAANAMVLRTMIPRVVHTRQEDNLSHCGVVVVHKKLIVLKQVGDMGISYHAFGKSVPPKE